MRARVLSHVGVAVAAILLSTGACRTARAGGEVSGGTAVTLRICEAKVFPDGTSGYTSGVQEVWRVNPGTSFRLAACTTRRSEYARVDFILAHHQTGVCETITVCLGPRDHDRQTRTLRTRDACTVKAVANSGHRTSVVLRLEARLGSW